MGQSTDAILVFGIQLKEEDQTPEFLGDFDDFDEYVDNLNGLSGADYKVRKDARESCPADMTMHCSLDYTMYVLSVRGTETVASRGYPKEIKTLDVSATQIEAFKEWCAARGIESAEPKWLLCSMWA